MSTPQSPISGYKVFLPDFTCNPNGKKHQFAENSTHTLKGTPELCEHGFHFCPKAADCFNYYKFNSDNIVCEVEAIGPIDGLNSEGNPEGDELCTTVLRIGRRIPWHEVLIIVNSGKDNTGLNNTGDWNTGDRNTGNLNTGNRNTGNRNTGNLNTGNLNTGDWNTGNRNTGNLNTGNLNTGDWNTGNRNTGNLNTGNLNTGDWNTTSFSTGVFCTEQGQIMMFDAPSGMTYAQWRETEAAYLMSDVRLTEWIPWYKMTDVEKERYPRAETQDGYLKRYEYKAAHATWWTELTDRQRALYPALPGFSKEKFKAITGIEIEQ